MADLDRLTAIAADLIGPWSDDMNVSAEYKRGMVELIATATNVNPILLDPGTGVWRDAIENVIDALRED